MPPYSLIGVLTNLKLVLELVVESSTPGSEGTNDEKKLSKVLALVADILGENPPISSGAEEQPASVPYALDLLQTLRYLLIATPTPLLLNRLLALQSGLLPWLHDHEEALTEVQYNDFVATLYTSILRVLGDVEASAVNLDILSPILTSGFTHIPPPLICPNAFQEFWTLKYKPISADLVANGYEYSEELKVCLQYFIVVGDASESFAAGVSSVLEESFSELVCIYSRRPKLSFLLTPFFVGTTTC